MQRNWGAAIGILILIVLLHILITVIEAQAAAILSVPAFVDVWATPGVYADDVVNTAPPAVGLSLWNTLTAFVILTPLWLGSANWYLRVTAATRPSMLRVFWAFASPRAYFKGLWLRLLLTGRSMLWLLLMVSLPAICAYTSIAFVRDYAVNFYEQNLGSLGLFVSAVLLLAAALFCPVFLCRYFLAKYYICEPYKRPVREAIRLSVRYTKGNILTIAGLYLSFLPWFALCVFVLPLFYVLPYLNASAALLAERMIRAGEMADTDGTREFG